MTHVTAGDSRQLDLLPHVSQSAVVLQEDRKQPVNIRTGIQCSDVNKYRYCTLNGTKRGWTKGHLFGFSWNRRELALKFTTIVFIASVSVKSAETLYLRLNHSVNLSLIVNPGGHLVSKRFCTCEIMIDTCCRVLTNWASGADASLASLSVICKQLYKH